HARLARGHGRFERPQQLPTVGETGQCVGVRHLPEVRLALGELPGVLADVPAGQALLSGEQRADGEGDVDTDLVQASADGDPGGERAQRDGNGDGGYSAGAGTGS